MSPEPQSLPHSDISPFSSRSTKAQPKREQRPSVHVVNSFGRSYSLPLPPCLFSVLSVPSWGRWINPPLSPSAAEASWASAILAVPWYSHASSCLLKGMLAEGTVAESWHRAAVEFSGWQ